MTIALVINSFIDVYIIIVVGKVTCTTAEENKSHLLGLPRSCTLVVFSIYIPLRRIPSAFLRRTCCT